MTEAVLDTDLRISWSRLRTHAECNRRSYLLRQGKSSPAKNVRDYFPGMVVDRLMRDWLDDPLRRPGQMRAGVTAMITRLQNVAAQEEDGVVRWRNPADRAEVVQFCADLVGRLEPILDEHIVPFPHEQAVRFKQPLVVPYLDGRPARIHLTGELDLLVRRPDGWVVWDLKGTRDNSYWRKVLGQLIFYDLYVSLAKGQRTARVGLIQPMCDQPVVDFEVSDDMRNTLLSRIASMALDVWRDAKDCTTTIGHCTRCVVKHARPKFGPDALSGPAGGSGQQIAQALRAEVSRAEVSRAEISRAAIGGTT